MAPGQIIMQPQQVQCTCMATVIGQVRLGVNQGETP